MATTTFFDLCEQLVEDAGISGNFTSVTGQTGEFQRVVNWVIRATTSVEGKWFDWDFLHTFYTFNTVVGISDYPAPADHNLWDNADTAKIPAEEMSLEFIMWTRKKKDPVALVAGTPWEYTVLPDKALRLYDTPTEIIQIGIEYWKRPTILVDSLDEPRIPVQFRDIIVAQALIYYANYESADEVKVQATESYADRMTQLESHSAPSMQAKDSLHTGTEIQVVADPGYY